MSASAAHFAALTPCGLSHLNTSAGVIMHSPGCGARINDTALPHHAGCTQEADYGLLDSPSAYPAQRDSPRQPSERHQLPLQGVRPALAKGLSTKIPQASIGDLLSHRLDVCASCNAAQYACHAAQPNNPNSACTCMSILWPNP